jgi:hypothetical protein
MLLANVVLMRLAAYWDSWSTLTSSFEIANND